MHQSILAPKLFGCLRFAADAFLEVGGFGALNGSQAAGEGL